jgi:hypothetical protein
MSKPCKDPVAALGWLLGGAVPANSVPQDEKAQGLPPSTPALAGHAIQGEVIVLWRRGDEEDSEGEDAGAVHVVQDEIMRSGLRRWDDCAHMAHERRHCEGLLPGRWFHASDHIFFYRAPRTLNLDRRYDAKSVSPLRRKVPSISAAPLRCRTLAKAVWTLR